MRSVSTFRSSPSSDTEPSATTISHGLGWLGVALGAAQLAVPRTLSNLVGIEPGAGVSTLMRLAGARQLASGLGVLLQPRRPIPIWARVAGDLVDLGLLGLAAGTRRTSGWRLAGAVAAVAGVTALDVLAAHGVQRSYEAANQPVVFSVTINKAPDEVYAFFRNFEQLPTFMDFLEKVEVFDSRRSHWTAKLPIGGTVGWDAVITEDKPGEAIAWESAKDSRIKTSGRVTFARTPGRNMTEVRVEMKLGFTGKHPSTLFAKFFAKPQIKGDLRRLKQVMETGEVLVSDASAHAAPHPAQPAADADHKPEVFIPNATTAHKGVTP